MTTPNVVEVHTPTTQVVEVAAIVGPKGDDGAPGAPGGVASVNGQTGDVVLELSSVLAKARKAPAGYWLQAYPWGSAEAGTIAGVASTRCALDVPFDQMALYVSTAAASGTGYVGVYETDADGMPTNLVASGSFDPTTIGAKYADLGGAVPAGVYWLALSLPTAATAIYRTEGLSSVSGMNGFLVPISQSAINVNGLPNTRNAYTIGAAGSALPATHPALGSAMVQAPAFWVRAASA